MSKETTAHTITAVKSQCSDEEIAALKAVGVLNARGSLVYSKDPQYGSLRKLADLPDTGRQYYGKIFVPIGEHMLWPVNIVRLPKSGKVIADYKVYRGQNQENFEPPFKDDTVKGAFASLMRAVPGILQTQGVI